MVHLSSFDRIVLLPRHLLLQGALDDCQDFVSPEHCMLQGPTRFVVSQLCYLGVLDCKLYAQKLEGAPGLPRPTKPKQ